MKILFINPALRPEFIQKLPNVGLAYVMTACHDAGIEFDLIDIDAYRYTDDEVKKLLEEKDYDVVGIGTLISHYKQVKRISRWIRQVNPNVKIIVGNTLGTSIPKMVLKNMDVDICVIGEGELTFLELLSAIENKTDLKDVNGIAYTENGKVITTPQRQLIENIDEIPFPNYDVFNMPIYIESSKHLVSSPDNIPIPFDDLIAFPLNTARGCPFKCTFCFHAFQNRKYRYRSPDNIIDELKILIEKYGVNYINFWDELSFYNLNATEEFAEKLLEADLNLHWIGTCRSELFSRKDGGERVLKKLKQAGCHGLGFALETGSPEILLEMNKANTCEEFIEQALLVRDAGIDTYSSLVIGYPKESFKTIDQTFDVLTKAMVYPSVGFLQVMPGTPMYDLALKEGHIKDEDKYLESMGDRQDIRINLTKFDDNDLMDYVTKKLLELNEYLKTGVDTNSLIKTKTYYAIKRDKDGKKIKKEVKTKKDVENFIQGFGVAGKVLRESDWTEKVNC